MHKTKIVRVLLMALVLVMSLSVLLTACSKPAAQPSNSPSESANGGESQEPGEAKLEPYELVILVAGDEPKDQQTVLDAVQEKVKDTSFNPESMLLSLHNQKCKVFDGKVITCEFVKNANLILKMFRYKVPVEIPLKS